MGLIKERSKRNPSFKEFLNEFGFMSTYPKGKPVSTGI
jgi:hypothetical protein